MPAWFIIFLFLLITGITKLYMWLGVTDPLKAIIAAALTTFVIVCALRRSGQKQAEQKEREKAAALEKENIQPQKILSATINSTLTMPPSCPP